MSASPLNRHARVEAGMSALPLNRHALAEVVQEGDGESVSSEEGDEDANARIPRRRGGSSVKHRLTRLEKCRMMAGKDHSGVFFDVLTRLGRKKRPSCISVIEMVLTAQRRPSRRLKLGEEAAIEDVWRAVDVEVLQRNLCKHVVKFLKLERLKGYDERSLLDSFRMHCFRIREFVRHIGCLQTAVEDRMASLDHVQREKNKRETDESLSEHTHRLHGFWQDYHATLRRAADAEDADVHQDLWRASYRAEPLASRLKKFVGKEQGLEPINDTVKTSPTAKKGAARKRVGSTTGATRLSTGSVLLSEELDTELRQWDPLGGGELLARPLTGGAFGGNSVLRRGAGNPCGILNPECKKVYSSKKKLEERPLCGAFDAETRGSLQLPQSVAFAFPDFQRAACNECTKSKDAKAMTRQSMSLPNIADPLNKRYARERHSRGLAVIGPMRDLKEAPAASMLSQSDGVSIGTYIHTCESEQMLPKPMPFLTGRSVRFSAWQRALVDSELLAVAAALAEGGREIEEADLEGNFLLTPRSLVPFLSVFFHDKGSCSKLQRLSLKDCKMAGTPTLDIVFNLLSARRGLQKLISLDLAGVPIPFHCHHLLCSSVKFHPTLQVLSLAGVGLGQGPTANQCLGDLTGIVKLCELDLGWNCFDGEAFDYLGKCMALSRTIKKLSLENSSSVAKSSGDEPILLFFERLGENNSLEYLDVSMNRMTFCGALVLEDVLQGHRRLQELRVCANPLGAHGIRSLLRLLSMDTSGLLYFDCSDSYTGKRAADGDIEDQLFNKANPSGRYALNLARPYHRSMLRMLYKITERFKVTPEAAFAGIVASPSYVHPAKDNKSGVWPVARSGKLEVTFAIDEAMLSIMQDVPEGALDLVLKRYFSITRSRPSFRKVVPLLATWKKLDGFEMEQMVFLQALSKDFVIDLPMFAVLSGSLGMFGSVLRTLGHCIVGGSAPEFLAIMQTGTVSSYMKTWKYTRVFRTFNAENPTGYYKLELDNPSHFAVGERLMVLDRWEAGLARRQGRPPTSQSGDYTNTRNVRYFGNALKKGGISSFQLPDRGSFEMSYVCDKRPRQDAKPLSKSVFDQLLVALRISRLEPKYHAQAVRAISHLIYIEAFQLRELIGLYSDPENRMELSVILVHRVIDNVNEKVYRVRLPTYQELNNLRSRLGQAASFPWIQPELARFEWDLSVYDERIAASGMVYLAARERPQNLRSYRYIRADGKEDPLLMGVPRSWEALDKIPKEGTFSAEYVCAPEDRNFKLRVQLCEKYGNWKIAESEAQVKWWAGLQEAPTDVLHFMVFLVTHFANLSEAFAHANASGNGQITSLEFRGGFFEVDGAYRCKLFKGENERDRVDGIFRYLDPSASGGVSEKEWGVLELLRRELQQSLQEFVHFLDLTFGSVEADFLAAAWDELDEDRRGEITLEKWLDVNERRLEYFGPSLMIFYFLDKDHEGTISFAEFQALRSMS